VGLVLTQGTGKQPTRTSVRAVRKHQRATKRPAMYVTRHCWLPLPALLHLLLLLVSTLCQVQTLVILSKAGSHSKYFNIFYLTGNLSLESISRTKPFKWSLPSSQSIQRSIYNHKISLYLSN